MFLPRKFDKYTNYNGYIVDRRTGAYEVEESRLLKVIMKMQEKYERVTKLITFSEVERMFTKD